MIEQVASFCRDLGEILIEDWRMRTWYGKLLFPADVALHGLFALSAAIMLLPLAGLMWLIRRLDGLESPLPSVYRDDLEGGGSRD